LASGDVTQARWAALLKRMMALKGLDAGRAVSPVIQPTYELSDAYKPEDRICRGDHLTSWGGQFSNPAAGSFALADLVNPGTTGRLCVIKRVTFSGIMPTSAQQPGNVFLGIAHINNFGGLLGTAGIPKDGRAPTFVTNNSTCSLFTGTWAGSSVNAFLSGGIYGFQVAPAAATAPYLYTIDNLDIVLVPNTQVGFTFAADAAIVTTYTWNLLIEGYERVLDPAELIPPP
jgi:hypothetical protein